MYGCSIHKCSLIIMGSYVKRYTKFIHRVHLRTVLIYKTIAMSIFVMPCFNILPLFDRQLFVMYEALHDASLKRMGTITRSAIGMVTFAYLSVSIFVGPPFNNKKGIL